MVKPQLWRVYYNMLTVFGYEYLARVLRHNYDDVDSGTPLDSKRSISLVSLDHFPRAAYVHSHAIHPVNVFLLPQNIAHTQRVYHSQITAYYTIQIYPSPVFYSYKKRLNTSHPITTALNRKDGCRYGIL